jgi:hypothetical protein
LTKEASMPPFASADSDTDFESGADPAHALGDPSTERRDAERPRETNARANRPDGARCHAANAADPGPDARRDAEEASTGKEEIEITPEMIEAGIAVLTDPEWSDSAAVEWLNGLWKPGHTPEDLIEAIYRAMKTSAAGERR